jgi:23S rRNA pseudouridine1911/1915/1917 synthase
MILNRPYIIEETNDFAVVFKPPKMHSAMLKQKDGGTLIEWYSTQSSPVFDLMHRLDFETHGLVLLAKTIESFEFFKALQDRGEFVKEYSVVCANAVCADSVSVKGFPPPPDIGSLDPSLEKPLTIESYFRPYGPGRKLVRPVINDGKKHKEIAMDKGGFYKTEITGIDNNVFTVKIRRGFRHQIRCHLCWIGFPILNDPLYNQVLVYNQASVEPDQNLALRAHALFFIDPSSGKQLEYRIEPLSLCP